MQEKLDVVIPLAPVDVSTFLCGLSWIKKYLPVKKIVVIGNKEVEKKINDCREISFINEDNLIPYNAVYNIIADITGNDPAFLQRTGWYLQQFLKMQYAYICVDEYYLLWDGDSIPTRNISFFEDGKPVFGVKNEFNEAYFNTMNRLIPQLKKSTELSYISEHMVISTFLMKELINLIEKNNLYRQPFYECILRNIDKKFLDKSGFSEFETYGTFCKVFYPDKYIEKKWYSLRPANYYFDINNLTVEDLRWIACDYQSISFEFYKSQKNKRLIINGLQFVFRCKWLRELLSIRTLCTPMETMRYIKQKWGRK